jgi:hypothetical protein
MGYQLKLFGHRGTYRCKCHGCSYEGKTHILDWFGDGSTSEEAQTDALEKARKSTHFDPTKPIHVIAAYQPPLR